MFTVGQRASFEFRGSNFVFTVTETVPVGALEAKPALSMTRGLLTPETTFFFESGNTSIKVSKSQRDSQVFEHSLRLPCKQSFSHAFAVGRRRNRRGDETSS